MTTSDPGASRQPVTLDTIAASAAAIITNARETGLLPPFALACHDYGPPAATLHLSEYDTVDIWESLAAWAASYEAEITTRPGYTPHVAYVIAAFTRDGIRYEVMASIRTRHDDNQAESGETSQAEDGSQPGTGQATA